MNENANILALCTGNSCRSQIAEGYLRHYAGNRFNVHSAGMEPAQCVHPIAVKIMQEDGIDISGGRPKHVKEFLGRMAVRYLIIVCGGANETCPRIFQACPKGCTGRSMTQLPSKALKRKRSRSSGASETKSNSRFFHG